MRRDLERLAVLRPPVLLQGETGTGKELAARLLHDASLRSEHAFVALNCAAIPAELAESELFGHVRGAFTGAHRAHSGAFVRADRGTLFLDEVAELPLTLQGKLLRVLETGRVTPVGSEHETGVDVRIVAATHRDMHDMVDTGELREDLYHRLGVFVIQLPALSERPEDVPILVAHFVEQASDELGAPVSITPEAMEAATRHTWPGNIRGLRNAVFRAAALSDGAITPCDLMPPLARRRDNGGWRPLESGTHARDAGIPVLQIPRGDFPTMKLALLQQIVREEGSIRRAARALKVPRSTLGAWLKRRDP